MLDDPSLDCGWLVISGDGDGHSVVLSDCVNIDDVNGCGWHQPPQGLGVCLSLPYSHQGQVEGCDGAIAFSSYCVVFHSVAPQ